MLANDFAVKDEKLFGVFAKFFTKKIIWQQFVQLKKTKNFNIKFAQILIGCHVKNVMCPQIFASLKMQLTREALTILIITHHNHNIKVESIIWNEYFPYKR